MTPRRGIEWPEYPDLGVQEVGLGMARAGSSAVIVVMAIASLTPLLAHHNVGADYDVCRTVTFDGVITGLDWRYPHVVLHLNVVGKDRRALARAVSTLAPSVLNREGLNDFFTKTGDLLPVMSLWRRTEPDAVTQNLILPGGRTVTTNMAPSGLREA